MSLTNSQYEAIMRQYSQRQLRSNRDLAKRREEAYARIPALRSLDEAVARQGVEEARARIAGTAQTGDRYRTLTEQAAARRRILLTQAGLPADYLEPQYTCPDCMDTGYRNGKPCHCFHQAASELLYHHAAGHQQMKSRRFADFSLACYPENVISPSTGLSSRENMRHVLQDCQNAAKTCPEKPFHFLFYGPTGLGKTFLSECTAGELMAKGCSVSYYSAFDLFDKLAVHAFGREGQEGISPGALSECDLLIIDDLGTELTNSFVQSQLFLLINGSLSMGKSMIISTNLALSDLASLYSERIFSRISSQFHLMEFFGSDIRLMQKLGFRPSG